MGIDSYIHCWVRGRLGKIYQLLPECTTQHSTVSGLYNPKPYTPQLHVSSTHYYRQALRKPRFLRGSCRDLAYACTGFHGRREDIVTQPNGSGHVRGPVALSE